MDYEGDAADELAAAGLRLKSNQAKLLTEGLHPGRRLILESEWAIPIGRLQSVDGDWDCFESLLRLLSDFLHDGITMRQSLSDELDQLAEQAHAKVSSPIELSRHLFSTGKLTGNRLDPFQIRNSDLAWCIQEGESNPLGLSLIYMLVAHRLKIPVFGCNYPGHFLSLISHQGQPTLIDAFHNGRATAAQQLLSEHPEISADAKRALKQPSTLADMLLRLLANLHFAFTKVDRKKVANLIQKLLKTVE